MANPKHVAVVKKGADAIEEWRQKHPEQILDLHEAFLFKAYLSEADLSRADLSEADIQDAYLYKANLAGANLSDANLSGAYLDKTKLNDADLSGANLLAAQCLWTDFSSTNFSGADLTLVTFIRANLTGADLSGAEMLGSRLWEVTLSITDFSGADLSGVSLIDSDLSSINLTGVTMYSSRLVNCNLAQCVGLETVKHEGPSYVDFGTLRTSFRESGNRFTPELETFFLNAGLPKELLDTLPRILAEVKYSTCFVCHGSPDLTFAEKLVKDLKMRGVSCWLYPMDYTPGRKVWGEIIERRREAEKMIVLCSAKALIRDGVLKEIEEQIDEDPDKIVPISLDNTWRESGFPVKRGQRDLKQFLLDRNYADFSDESKYEASLNRLLKGIKREGK